MIKKNIKTCYIYARSATATQKEFASGQTEAIKRQINECQKYAKKHDYKVLGIFTDIGSGATLKRKNLQRLLFLCKKSPSSAILIHNISRLTRSVKIFNEIQTLLKEKDTHLISTQDGELTDSFISYILLGVAQWEAEGRKPK